MPKWLLGVKGQLSTQFKNEIWFQLDQSLQYSPEDFSSGLITPYELSEFQKKKRQQKAAYQKEQRYKRIGKKRQHELLETRFFQYYPDMLYRKLNKDFKCPHTKDFVLNQKCSYGDCQCEKTGRLPQRPEKRLFP